VSTPPSNVIAFPDTRVSDLDAFLRTLTAPTRRVYAQVISAYTSFYGRSIEAASSRDIEAYLAHLYASGRTPATIGKVLSALSRYYGFLVRDEIISKNPVKGVKRPKISDESTRKGTTPAEVQAILAQTDDSTAGLRDRAMITLLVLQGWRIFEVLGLTIADLDEESGHRVATVRGKGGKTQRVTLAAPSYAALTAWVQCATLTDGPVFVAVRHDGTVVPGKAISTQAAEKRIASLSARAGLRHIHPHLFRHGAVTTALDEGVSLRSVQDFARHADPRTTRRYDSQRNSLNNPTTHVLAAKLLGKS